MDYVGYVSVEDYSIVIVQMELREGRRAIYLNAISIELNDTT